MKRASDIANRQFGSISRPQLLAAGFTSAMIVRWVAAGRLFPRYRGVYAWGRPDLPEKGELIAALLFAGPGAALGGLSELWWLGLLGRRPNRVHIDTPRRFSSQRGLRLRQVHDLARELHKDVPIGPLPSALRLASPTLSFNAPVGHRKS